MKEVGAMVSVIIPCFCCAATIRRAVDSVYSQTLLPTELILIDDASSDNCETINLLWQLRDEYSGRLNIKVIALEYNSGAASARNAGWNMVSQPYIAFLDADDSWHPEKIRIQYEYMLKNPSIALSGHQCYFLSDSEILPEVANYDFKVTSIGINKLLFKNSFSTPTVMLRRDVNFRFAVGKRYAEDVLLWQQVSSSGLQMVRIEMPLAFVHKEFYGAGGLSSHLWKMEMGELSNFYYLYNRKCISEKLMVLAILFSLLKYFRRLFINWFRCFSLFLKV